MAVDEDLQRMSSFWGKSNAAGRWHPLMGHLLDAAAVAELIWDEFLTAAARRQVDRSCNGNGRDALRLAAGWHDLGKATPAFQVKNRERAAAVAQSGLQFPAGVMPRLKHGESGAHIAAAVLQEEGATGAQWLLPVISGHHGSFLAADKRDYRLSDWQQGPNGTWFGVQRRLAVAMAGFLEVDLRGLSLALPAPAVQLAFAGWVSMADWIASSDLFPGLGDGSSSVELARSRARGAWDRLGLRGSGPWSEQRLFQERFGFAPTPLQTLVSTVAADMPDTGLIIVEAPMGAGKTEAALAATEVLAHRTGATGVLFAMPTQGTTDAMYARVETWAKAVAPNLPVSLLHGKAMANESWRTALGRSVLTDICDDGESDPYGWSPSTEALSSAGTPSEWLIGRHRGLLAPAAVCTVDQPLMAATHVKYVSLRFAGLIGKTVIIDEVHSYDVFMSEYLCQFLRWCGDGEVPVILMSATLSPGQREQLLAAYANGLEGDEARAGESPGYPCVTSWTPKSGPVVRAAPHIGRDLSVDVQWSPIADPDDVESLARLILHEVGDMGVALVILNTVRRAQDVYRALRASGAPSILLHGRLATSARAERTSQLVADLGKSGTRPERLIIVATQIAEQSFDVDADLLVTDVAPMDLLLQRIGRLHRHDRPDAVRGRHTKPRVIVCGVTAPASRPPTFASALPYVYDSFTLLRTAELLGSAGRLIQIPQEVPGLVEAAYDLGRGWPEGWGEQGAAALADTRAAHADRVARARLGLLMAPMNSRKEHGTLAKLHGRTGVEARSERITVRDGEPSREVALVRWDPVREVFSTLAGRRLGVTGELVATDAGLRADVLGDTVRVRDGEPLAMMKPLDGWGGVDFVRDLPAVRLDGVGRCVIAGWGTVTYDNELGLVITRFESR